jgi:hypothetical protein
MLVSVTFLHFTEELQLVYSHYMCMWGHSVFLKYLLVLVGGGVSLVIPVQGTQAQQLLTTRGHDVIIFTWNHENATFACLTNSKNFTVIATVESNQDKAGNRWNDGKADVRGRLWAGRLTCWRKTVTSNVRKTFKS